MGKAKRKVYDVHQVISDILYEAEKGGIDWDTALKWMKNELKSIDLRKIKK